jgi:hypothetical protein
MHAISSTHLAQTVSPEERRRGLAWGIFAGIVAAVLVLLLALGVITLLNTNTTVNAVRDAQVNHTVTLQHIDAIARADRAELAQLAKATTTVDAILAEAGQVSKNLTTNEYLICQALSISGCVAG